MRKLAYSEVDNLTRDNSTETKFWRDRLKPELKRSFMSAPAAIGAGLLVDGLKGGEKATQLAAVLGAAAANSYLRQKDVKKLNERYNVLDEEGEKNERIFSTGTGIASGLMGVPVPVAGLATTLISSPEARIQKARREEEKKKALQLLTDKEASVNAYKGFLEKIAYSEKDNLTRDSSTETKFWRDRLKPEIKRNFLSSPLLIGSGLAAYGATKGNTKAIALASAIGSSVGQAYLRQKDVEKLNERYKVLNEAEEKKEKNYSALSTIGSNAISLPLPIAGFAGALMSSPEARIQKARREEKEEIQKERNKEKEMNNKEASISLYKDILEKEALFGKKLKFTKENPNPLNEQEFNEYINLGAKIDDKQNLGDNEISRFNELAVRSPKSYFKPHLVDSDKKFKLTKENPNPLSKEEMKEYIDLGAKIDNKSSLSEDETKRFNELAVRSPKSYFKPHLADR